MRFVFVFALSACVPSDEVGRQAWSRPIDELHAPARAGRNGHVAVAGGTELELISPTGSRVWGVPREGQLMDVAVDDAGGAIMLRRAAPFAGTEPDTEATLARLDGDGVARWTVNRRIPTVALIVLDAEDATWVVSSLRDTFQHWERYDAAGALVGSGDLPFAMATSGGHGFAIPNGGIAVPDNDGGVSAIDASGALLWRVAGEPSGRAAFVVHDDGELTVRYWEAVVRFDAGRAERWRRRVGVGDAVTGVSDGAVIVTASDGLGESREVSTISHLGAMEILTARSCTVPPCRSCPDRHAPGFALHLVREGAAALEERTFE